MNVITDAGRLQAGLNQKLPILAALPFSAMEAVDGLFPEYPDISLSHGGRFESLPHYDWISLFLIKGHYSVKDREQICICLQKDLLLIFHNEQKLVTEFLPKAQDDPTPGHALCHFFASLIEDEPDKLEELELQVANLEEELLTRQNKKSYIQRIILLKKKLLMIRHEYTQLDHITEGLLNNENGFLTKEELRMVEKLQVKIDRLNQYAITLRDYVTQVREAYQAQMDLQLNDVMKVLTVLTAIFSPLTLIVGWYGMNFHMPEYGSVFGYPGVILFSVAVFVVSMVIFRKKHWL